ncbi:hypothetical protein OAN96_00705 [Candidatus Gracilibacteria bacterium]|nr:hypothetical protein [Candidatus Gracilibacteria bacterium]
MAFNITVPSKQDLQDKNARKAANLYEKIAKNGIEHEQLEEAIQADKFQKRYQLLCRDVLNTGVGIDNCGHTTFQYFVEKMQDEYGVDMDTETQEVLNTITNILQQNMNEQKIDILEDGLAEAYYNTGHMHDRTLASLSLVIQNSSQGAMTMHKAADLRRRNPNIYDNLVARLKNLGVLPMNFEG